MNNPLAQFGLPKESLDVLIGHGFEAPNSALLIVSKASPNSLISPPFASFLMIIRATQDNQFPLIHSDFEALVSILVVVLMTSDRAISRTRDVSISVRFVLLLPLQ